MTADHSHTGSSRRLQESKYNDVIIIGAGITGTSLLFTLCRYSGIKKVLILEKYGGMAQLNSNSRNNAQTLHFGDIETNYSPDKAKETNRAAKMVLNYLSAIGRKDSAEIYRKVQKMVLATDDGEVESLEKTYSTIKKIFPELKIIGGKEIAKLEPNVVKGRDKDDAILALNSPNGYMVDFGKLTNSFMINAKRTNKTIESRFNEEVISLEEKNGFYEVNTRKGRYYGKFVVFASGTYSLYFAKTMGMDRNLSVLAVGGDFYYSKKVLRGKVYRVQKGGIPFAAVHGDPDIANKRVTRFGPTVSLPLELERGHIETLADYIRTFDFDIDTMISLKNILLDKDIQRILSRNIIYSIPIIGKYEFAKMEASKIVPSIKADDLTIAKDIGGIRPQIIDSKKRALVLGEEKITKDGMIFNVTPSPGATSCLASAYEDARYITKYLGIEFDESRFAKEIGIP